LKKRATKGSKKFENLKMLLSPVSNRAVSRIDNEPCP
jgi:hypothetical protein